MPWPDEAARVIAGALRAQLPNGCLQTGTVLSSDAQLAVSHLISRRSARPALRHLAADGLIVRVPGRGPLAAPSAQEVIRAGNEIR